MLNSLSKVTTALSPVALLLLAPLITGILNKFRARIEARTGPSIFQPYYDLKKLMAKEIIVPDTSSWVFHLFPYLILTISISLSFLIPIFSLSSEFSYFSDLIFIFALFLLIAFLIILASFDAGTSFVGMGSSREAFLNSLSEPVIMLIILALSLESNSTNLFEIVAESLHGFKLLSDPGSFFVAIAFVIVILTEAKRFPVDNPSTHLELTMIHEALLLEYSGPYLAMLEYASMLKLSLLITMFFSLFFSYGMVDDMSLMGLGSAIGAWLLKMIVFVLFIAFYEKSTAKLRLFKVPELLSFAMVLSLIGIFAHYYIQSW